MAIIGRIREKSGILVGTIGAAIILFLVMDVFTGQNGLFGQKNTENIGEINGKEISAKYFQQRLDEAVENYKANTQQQKVDENTMAMLRDQVWNELLREQLNGEEYDKLGIQVSEEELLDMVKGNNIHPSVKQAFTDPQTGQFSVAQVVNFLKNLDKQPADVQNRWVAFEKYIYNERLNAKYNTLLSKGLYATKLMADNYNNDNNARAYGRVVFMDYTTISDSTIKPTEDELMDYFNKHRKDFEAKDNIRKADYVMFDVLPSGEDSAAVLDAVSKEKEGLAASTDDSAYVSLNSELPFEDRYFSRKTLASAYSDSLFNASKGFILGPYMENGYMKVTKVMDKTMRADSVSARHILVKVDQGQDPAAKKAKADSLFKLAKSGANFAILATQNSDDPGSAAKGGDLGKFAEGMMVKPFNDACFNGNKGDIVMVESQFGYHIIEVLENNRTTPSIKLATIAKKFEPSEATYKAVYNKATKFASTGLTGENFDQTVEKQGLTKRTAETITINDRAFNGVPDTRAVVRWAFEAEKGEVSKVFDTQNAYLIAVVRSVQEKDKADFESSKSKIEEAVRKEKKAEQLMAKADKAIASAKGDINLVGTSLNSPAQPINDVTFASGFLPAYGRELAVTGTMFGIKPKLVSKPIKGERGVYVVTVDSLAPAQKITDYAPMKVMAGNMFGNRVFESFNALKEKAKIEDNRHLFY